MNRCFLLSIGITLLSILSLSAQKNKGDAVLFSVDGTPIHLSEFQYIYSKTNGEKADFSRASLDEYLDLYIKFKLKVQKAKEMKLDTIRQLNQELAGYRRQLADSYLIDKQVTGNLTKEVYERSKEDVDISHILVQVKRDASPEEEAAALQKIQEIKKQIDAGADFAEVAKSKSEDTGTAKNGGRIGYLKPLFPKGFYSIETAVYQLSSGQVSDPVRSSFGYHLIKLNEKRPARGEIEAAHVLIRTAKKPEGAAKAKIDSLYQALENGADFGEVARLHSEDKKTARTGGNLGLFGINKFEKSFEDAAFSLGGDGSYSQPFQTSVGWHIIKRISLRGLQPYNVEKRRLEKKIQADPRFEEARTAMVDKIKRENNFKEDGTVLDEYIKSLDETFFARNWKPTTGGFKGVLFSFGEKYKATTDELGKMMYTSTRKRTSMKAQGIDKAVRQFYNSFVINESLKFEETQLEEKYPDFKALMREYEEGILLFEATKMLVWDKAAQDSAGLEAFYANMENKYQWGERATISNYKIPDAYADKVEEVREFARKNRPSLVLEKFNTDKEKIVSISEEQIEKGKDEAAERLNWKVNGLSTNRQDSNGFTEFLKIENITPPRDKSINEARGYIIADYQDYLEKNWIEQLRKEYKVKVNKKVFESMVKP